MEQQVASLMVHLKSTADMLSTRSRVHDLAAALQKYVKDKGHFPRGTADRPPGDRFIAWAPDQRVSWMAELLPYLGDGDYAGLPVDPTRSWQEGDNLNVAGVLVAAFIGRSVPPTPPQVRYPGVPREVAVTNFVGVAGVGMDAAELPLGNPKAGVFGYDRETKLDDVKDGLDKTIVLLQVPPDFKDPWLAGGARHGARRVGRAGRGAAVRLRRLPGQARHVRGHGRRQGAFHPGDNRSEYLPGALHGRRRREDRRPRQDRAGRAGRSDGIARGSASGAAAGRSPATSAAGTASRRGASVGSLGQVTSAFR